MEDYYKILLSLEERLKEIHNETLRQIRPILEQEAENEWNIIREIIKVKKQIKKQEAK
jgi:hypothetical protein